MNDKRLARSTNDRFLAGVCGGIAETYNVDATLVRLAFAVATLLGFSGILVYLVLWFVMPQGY